MPGGALRIAIERVPCVVTSALGEADGGGGRSWTNLAFLAVAFLRKVGVARK